MITPGDRSGRSWPDEPADPARAGRRLGDRRARDAHVPDDGVVDRRRGPRPRERRLHGLPGTDGHRWACSSASSARRSGWGRWLTYLVGAVFAALIVPIVVGLQLPGGGTLALAYAATATSMFQAVYDLAVLDLQLTERVRPLHAVPGTARVGHLDVRVVRGVRPSPAAQRDRHRRARPAHQHGADHRGPAALPRPVHAVGPAPARPLPRARRADRVAAAADRRPGVDLGDLPARRRHLHRGRRLRVAPPDERGPVRPARRLLERAQHRPRRALPVAPALPADRREHAPHRQRLRPERDHDPGQLAPERRPRRDDQGAGHREAQVLLAGHELRRVHDERLAEQPAGEDPAGHRRGAARRHRRGARPARVRRGDLHRSPPPPGQSSSRPRRR